MDETLHSISAETVAITVVIATVILFFVLLSLRLKSAPQSKSHDVPTDEKAASAKPTPVSKKKKGAPEKRKDSKIPYSHRWLLTTLKGHGGSVLDLDFSGNGKYLASCADDRTVMLWNAKTFLLKDHKHTRANIEFDYAWQVKWSPDCKAFVISQYNHNAVQVYRVGRKEDGTLGNTEPILTFPTVHKAEIINIGIACNGRFILSCSRDTTLIIWDLKGEVLSTIDTHLINNYYACVSPCGRFVAASGFTPDVKIWEVCFSKNSEFKEVKRAFELKSHSSGVYCFAFSNSSTRMASVSKDGTWKLWDTDIEYDKGQEPYLLLTGAFNSPSKSLIALSPDGRTVTLACGYDMVTFSGVTGNEQEKFEEIHNEYISCILYSPNGKYLLAAGGRHIRVFNNVLGFKNTIEDLEMKKQAASTVAIKERLQVQIDEAKTVLKTLETTK